MTARERAKNLIEALLSIYEMDPRFGETSDRRTEKQLLWGRLDKTFLVLEDADRAEVTLFYKEFNRRLPEAPSFTLTSSNTRPSEVRRQSNNHLAAQSPPEASSIPATEGLPAAPRVSSPAVLQFDSPQLPSAEKSLASSKADLQGDITRHLQLNETTASSNANEIVIPPTRWGSTPDERVPPNQTEAVPVNTWSSACAATLNPVGGPSQPSDATTPKKPPDDVELLISKVLHFPSHVSPSADSSAGDSPHPDMFSMDVIGFFREILCKISGSETESQELLMGIAISRGPIEDTSNIIASQHLAPPADTIIALLNPLNTEEETSIGERLIEIAPFSRGGQYLPLLWISEKAETENTLYPKLEPRGIYYREARASIINSTHDFYKMLACRDAEVRIIWLKPARAIRIYGDGKLLLQRMVLRSSQRAIYRDPDELRRLCNAACERIGFDVLKDDVIERVMITAIQLSEERHGGAVYFMMEKTYNILSKTYHDNIDAKKRKTGTTPIRDRHISRCRKIETRQGGNKDSFVNLPLEQVLMSVRQDGATIITPDGKILANGVYFNGAGGRRDSAKHICCESRGDANLPVFAIVISQDGEIYVTGDKKLEKWGYGSVT